MMLSVWFRVIRIRFLLASVIAVSVGLALNWWQNSTIEPFDALLTFGGVMALHASVDLLNDFWDFKRGIDTKTPKTKMSGGTGVLPEGLLKPSSVYRAGIAFLVIGSAIGAYFVITDGIIIAVILGFAILSIYFYSTKIVDSGLGEFFVAVKGSMIVLGTFFIQSGQITLESILAGIVVGSLSSLVLFIASFPDHDADKSKGRKTLVIAVGKQKATKLFWIFPLVSYCAIIIGVSLNLFPIISLIIFLRGNKEKKKANKLLLLKSLRTQMNPHFIFNSLNSVNSFISQSDERSANKYLSEFSRLMRMVLENSKHDFVSLTSELKTLELYLRLEHLRFEDKFDFQFDVKVESSDEVKVPPMLIQPYIENAVWHGLRYKEKKGMLKVECTESERRLLWIIQDNGIGRSRSKELKTKHQSEGKSTGMKNTEERLRIIKQLYNQDISLSVSDLNQDGTGTKVEIEIPKKIR